MSDLGTMRSEVARVLGLEDVATGPQDLMTSWINEGVVDILVRTNCRVLPGDVALTAGDSDYTMDTDILVMLDVFVTSSGNVYPLEKVSLETMLDFRRRTEATSSPPFYFTTAGANLFLVYPTPTAADVITTYYVPRPDTLVDDTDIPDEVPTEWHKLIVYYALFRAADFDDDSSSGMGQRYQQLYEVGIRQMLRQQSLKGRRRLAPARIGRARRYVTSDPARSWH